MTDQEYELILQAQEGNLRAFEELVKKYEGRVMNLAFSLLNNRQDAEDIYQETFMRVFKHLKSFRFESDFYTWVYRIVANLCFNLRKQRKRYTTYSLDEEYEDGRDLWKLAQVESPKTPEEESLDNELRRQIDEAIDQLPSQQRTVFVLKHYHQRKIKEIADLVGITEGTVKRYLFRATNRLRGLLEPYAIA
ncbi:RNA polymerase sigma factor [candidate division KSB1 bacterium]|nr:RNA polymerase sigma factor [candidate division KSB1 bacterium]